MNEPNRAPLWTLSDEELQEYEKNGTEQERRGARMILTNRWHQKHNPRAFQHPSRNA